LEAILSAPNGGKTTACEFSSGCKGGMISTKEDRIHRSVIRGLFEMIAVGEFSNQQQRTKGRTRREARST
jgi:hypothetical protein